MTQSNPLRILFAGTPEFACPSLLQLIKQPDEHIEVIGCYTQPDRPAGRGRKLTASPVKALALEYNIPVFQPESLKSKQVQADIAKLAPDLMIVIAYGCILPQAVLDIPTYGCLNIHASLLPKWRGAAPIQRSIQAGDKQTGIAIMQMDKGLDTGAVLAETHYTIELEDSSQSIHDKLAQIGADTLVKVIAGIQSYQEKAQIQSEQDISYAHKISKEEAWIDWQQDAFMVHRHIAAFNPWPVTQSQIASIEPKDATPKTIRIWQSHYNADIQSKHTHPAGTLLEAKDIVQTVAKQSLWVVCGDSKLIELRQLQFKGSKQLTAADAKNGNQQYLCSGNSFIQEDIT